MGSNVSWFSGCFSGSAWKKKRSKDHISIQDHVKRKALTPRWEHARTVSGGPLGYAEVFERFQTRYCGNGLSARSRMPSKQAIAMP